MNPNIPNDDLSLSNILKPVWSHQHGAYITLITCWLIGTILSKPVGFIHAVIFVFLMAGLNLGELVQEYLKKKFAVSLRKKVWIIIYGSVTGSVGFYLLRNTVSFNLVFPLLVFVGFIYLFLSLRREHKHVFSELLAFAAIVLAGLTALNPHQMPGIEFLKLWVLLSCYFGTSVFLVKARFDKASGREILLYLVFCVVITFYVIGFSAALLCVLFLIAVKLFTVVFAESRYKRLSITAIGFLECGYCLILITVLLIAH